MSALRTFGWFSSFEEFCKQNPIFIRNQLHTFVGEAGQLQLQAWDDSIPMLQNKETEMIQSQSNSAQYSNVLEYRLPLEARRIDVVLLGNGTILVVELKGKSKPSQADIDQVAAYARDLVNYHRECVNRPVYPILVPTKYEGNYQTQNGIYIVGPNNFTTLCSELITQSSSPSLSPDAFLDFNSYAPLPTLVQAARELFEKGELREIYKARAATDPAVKTILDIFKQAAETKSRHLVLLTGIPGSGKTLVGLRLVHDRSLDRLAVERQGQKPSAPAIFLSGNGPLVEVLQYVLRGGGGGGKTFVRGVKDYVRHYTQSKKAIPKEHVIIFDEAQRAWDASQVAEKHKDKIGPEGPKSEPEHFVEFGERIPEWCVLIGLIGEGQEIHIGEEAGLIQWRWAIEKSNSPSAWTIHTPPAVFDIFKDSNLKVLPNTTLNLDTEIRNHMIPKLHLLIDKILNGSQPTDCKSICNQLQNAGLFLYITRDVDIAKSYMKSRYSKDTEARFGLIASSRDKSLVQYGITNDYQSTKQIKLGPWYSDRPESKASCCQLSSTVTEFQAQGLELDMTLLCWGTDFAYINNKWNTDKAKGFQRGTRVKDPFRLRQNAYRVLLTRGREGTVIFVPPDNYLDETYEYLIECGIRQLSM
jgi:DUF2075 family protein